MPAKKPTEDSAKSPQTGEKAPAFTAPALEGESVALGTILKSAGSKGVVLFFYPKDDTPGCTQEAIDFTRLTPKFKALNISVLGISRDNLKKHEKFRSKHGLRVNLLADEEGVACQAYGVWVEKSMYGRKYMGIERSTFYIDAKGIVQGAWRKVKVPNHAQEVLDFIHAAQNKS